MHKELFKQVVAMTAVNPKPICILHKEKEGIAGSEIKNTSYSSYCR